MHTMKRLALVGAALTILVVTAGCGDDDNPIAPTLSPRVMVVHMSPDAPEVDILVDDKIISSLAGLAYPNNSGYLVEAAGARNFKLNLTGTSTTVLDTTLALVQGNSYTVVACDSASKVAGVILVDDLKAPAAGKAHVRFAHFSPNAPAVDVAVQGGAVVFANQSFKQFTDFTPLDAGSYDLEVRLAGEATVVLTLNGVALQEGKIYTVLAKGFVGGAGTQELGAEIIVNN